MYPPPPEQKKNLANVEKSTSREKKSKKALARRVALVRSQVQRQQLWSTSGVVGRRRRCKKLTSVVVGWHWLLETPTRISEKKKKTSTGVKSEFITAGSATTSRAKAGFVRSHSHTHAIVLSYTVPVQLYSSVASTRYTGTTVRYLSPPHHHEQKKNTHTHTHSTHTHAFFFFWRNVSQK